MLFLLPLIKLGFYDYATEEDYNAKENRIVSFETILPTIHRYAKEQYAVTIFNEKGEPIVRYDLYTEGFMTNWNETIKRMEFDENAKKKYNDVKSRLSQVQSVVNNDIGKNIDIMEYIGTTSTIAQNSSKLLYRGETDIETINIVAPWIGNPDVDTLDRIKADMSNKNYEKNEIKYYGKNLQQYKDKKFKEKFIEIATSGETVTDGNDSIETIKGNKKLEIIYIMQP